MNQWTRGVREGGLVKGLVRITGMQVLEYNIAFIYKSAIYLQIVIRRSVLLLVFHMIGNRITVLA